MYLCITGFIPNNDEDDSVKFELHLDRSYNEAIAQTLGHSNLHSMAEGLWDLTAVQAEEISHGLEDSFLSICNCLLE